jgi:hypothetical protein
VKVGVLPPAAAQSEALRGRSREAASPRKAEGFPPAAASEGFLKVKGEERLGAYHICMQMG